MKTGISAEAAKFICFAVCLIVAIFYLCYLAAYTLLMISIHTDPHSRMLAITHELPQSDFARLWYEGKILVAQRIETLGQVFPNSPWFKSPPTINFPAADPHPAAGWLYPPTMGLLAILFSFMPLALSYWVWRGATLAIAAICLRRAGLGWLVIAAGLACPGEIYDVTLGQNGALTAGLFVSALLLLDAEPGFGALAGLLCIKPQIALAFPLILLRRRRFKALLWCLGTATAIILLSLVIEGRSAWITFFAVSQPTSARIMNAPLGQLAPGGFTVLMMARTFHATVSEAWMIQAICSAISGFSIWRIWREPTEDAVGRMALTVCLSVLITPYGFLYDLISFSIAMAAMFARSSARERPIYAVLWLLSGYTGTLANLTGFVLMPIPAAIAAWLVWRQIKGKFSESLAGKPMMSVAAN